MGILLLLLFSCTKKVPQCPKEGYQYVNETFHCWYNPGLDSIPVGDTLLLEASIPTTFIDQARNTLVTNTASVVEGPLVIGMIYPTYQAAADSFKLIAQVGKVIKDTVQFPEGQLKGFRTIRWEKSTADSFTIRIGIVPLAKGTYSLALTQQSAKDSDCALYKYFLSPGNDQHLNYWMDAFGNVSDQVAFYAYCFKVY